MAYVTIVIIHRMFIIVIPQVFALLYPQHAFRHAANWLGSLNMFCLQIQLSKMFLPFHQHKRYLKRRRVYLLAE